MPAAPPAAPQWCKHAKGKKETRIRKGQIQLTPCWPFRGQKDQDPGAARSAKEKEMKIEWKNSKTKKPSSTPCKYRLIESYSSRRVSFLCWKFLGCAYHNDAFQNAMQLAASICTSDNHPLIFWSFVTVTEESSERSPRRRDRWTRVFCHQGLKPKCSIIKS